MDPRALSRSAAALLALALVSPSAPARAQTALQSQRASHNTFRVDGSLRDWSSVAMQSFGSGDDASFEFAMAQDAEGLYVAARVRDERMIRTRRPGNREDVLVLTLATPGERGLEAVEFWLYAGEEGSSAAVALMAEPGGRPRPARGARILEAADLLLDQPFGCLPVVENGALVGIVTEADLLRWAMRQLREQTSRETDRPEPE